MKRAGVIEFFLGGDNTKADKENSGDSDDNKSIAIIVIATVSALVLLTVAAVYFLKKNKKVS